MNPLTDANGPQTLQTAFASAVNARIYGATGNGTTDDTSAIANAVTVGLATGRPVFLPAGTYIVTGITVSTGLYLFGAGLATVIKLKNGSNTRIIGLDPSLVTFANNVVLRDFAVDGNKANNTTAPDAIRMQGNNILIQNVSVSNCNQAAINIGYGVCTNVSVLNCTVTNPANSTNNYGGIAFTRVFNGTIRGCVVTSTEGFMTYGIDIEPNAGYAPSECGNVVIDGNKVVGGQITVTCSNATGQCPGFVVSNNVVNNSTGKANSTTAVPPLVFVNVTNCTVTGNVCTDPATATGSCRGVYLDKATNISIVGNEFTVTNTASDEAVVSFTNNPSTGTFCGNTVNGISTSSTQPRFITSGQETNGRGFRFSGNRVFNLLQGSDVESFAGWFGTAVTNTTVETSFLTGSAFCGSRYSAANTMTVGKSYRISIYGIVTVSAALPTITLNFKLGSVTLIGRTVTPVLSSNKEWFAELVVNGRSSGATGVVNCSGFVFTDASATLLWSLRGSGATVDNTADQAFDVTMTWGAGVTAGDTISCNGCTITPLN